MGEENKNLIFKDVPREILTYLLKRGEEYIFGLSVNLVRSYKSVYDSIKYLEKEGLVTITKRGRRKCVNLTEKGKTIAQMFSEIESKEVSKNEGLGSV